MQNVGQKRKRFLHNETLLETSSPGNQLTQHGVYVRPTPGKTPFPERTPATSRNGHPSTPLSPSPSDSVAGSTGPVLPAGVQRGATDPHRPRGTAHRCGREHMLELSPHHTLAGQSAAGVGAASCWGDTALQRCPSWWGPPSSPTGGSCGPRGTDEPGCASGPPLLLIAPPLLHMAPPLPLLAPPRCPPCRCASPLTFPGCSRSSRRCRRGWRRRRPPGLGRWRQPGRRAARPRRCGPRQSGRGCGSSCSTPLPVPPRPARVRGWGARGAPVPLTPPLSPRGPGEGRDGAGGRAGAAGRVPPGPGRGSAVRPGGGLPQVGARHDPQQRQRTSPALLPGRARPLHRCACSPPGPGASPGQCPPAWLRQAGAGLLQSQNCQAPLSNPALCHGVSCLHLHTTDPIDNPLLFLPNCTSHFLQDTTTVALLKAALITAQQRCCKRCNEPGTTSIRKPTWPFYSI